jgi:hypothetical protein
MLIAGVQTVKFYFREPSPNSVTGSHQTGEAHVDGRKNTASALAQLFGQ